MHRRDGFSAVACELGKLTATTNLCAPDPIDAKLAKGITVKGGKAQALIAKAETSPKTAQKLVNRALKALNVLRNRVARAADRNKITASCRTRLDALLAERVGLVQGLAAP